MSTPHPAVICMSCPERALCRKLFQKDATCEHWPTGVTPGLGTLARRAGTAMVQWIAAGAPLATEAAQQQRLALCQVCPHWDPTAYRGTGSCAHPSCHCTRAKLALATSQCPMGKWLQELPGGAN